MRCGTFQPNLGIKVRNERLEREKRTRRLDHLDAEKPVDAEEQQRLRVLGEIREMLGEDQAARKQGPANES